jgi:succinate dehydrogenase / fumarate reductase flavoprotein subunit
MRFDAAKLAGRSRTRPVGRAATARSLPGGINAAKTYQHDGGSIQRLFYDTIKGGAYRAREANVFRLAQSSENIIDQCFAQGCRPREDGGRLDNPLVLPSGRCERGRQ